MRAFNFSPGPAALPLEVMEQAREELLDWQHSGMSVMEVSHRGTAFMQVAAEAEEDLRELLSIPRNYKVLFMQGGASAQFSLVPMNLAAPHSTVDYINTGHWSRKAIVEASRYCTVHIAGDAGGHYMRVPAQSELRFSANAAYAHYTPNETISGVEFGYVPEAVGVPLIADMSSSILSRPIDVSKFGLIYAGAQKNIGPSGLTVVIVREDLIGHARPETPLVFNYKAMAERSLAAEHAADVRLVHGGPRVQVAEDARADCRRWASAIASRRKCCTPPSMIPRSTDNSVARDSRSWMNVTFALRKPELDAAFLGEAAAAGLQGLKGHRVRRRHARKPL